MDRVRIADADTIRGLREDYLRSLTVPVDGMWESVVIGGAACWELRDRARPVGYYWVDAENTLLRCHMVSAGEGMAAPLFRALLDAYGIRQALAGTGETRYFALCHGAERGSAVEHYLFRDRRQHNPVESPDAITFRRVVGHERAAFEHFYRENTAGDGGWIAAFLAARFRRGELFGGYAQGLLVATGECIPSRSQPPYADLGVVVARRQRGRGLGRAVLRHLKERCYAAGWEPICSCDATNVASRRAIEGAGFVSEYQVLRIQF